ncbi:MAG: hypothetical protein ACI83P_001363 [Janthinobacterium sp.]|jgi:hypothetical protein
MHARCKALKPVLAAGALLRAARIELMLDDDAGDKAPNRFHDWQAQMRTSLLD